MCRRAINVSKQFYEIFKIVPTKFTWCPNAITCAQEVHASQTRDGFVTWKIKSTPFALSSGTHLEKPGYVFADGSLFLEGKTIKTRTLTPNSQASLLKCFHFAEKVLRQHETLTLETLIELSDHPEEIIWMSGTLNEDWFLKPLWSTWQFFLQATPHVTPHSLYLLTLSQKVHKKY